MIEIPAAVVITTLCLFIAYKVGQMRGRLDALKELRSLVDSLMYSYRRATASLEAERARLAALERRGNADAS